jgi:hypothetical protein
VPGNRAACSSTIIPVVGTVVVVGDGLETILADACISFVYVWTITVSSSSVVGQFASNLTITGEVTSVSFEQAGTTGIIT